jgi:hypothetical protein
LDKKMTGKSLFGRKMTRKVVLPVKCTQAPNVQCCTMDLIAILVTRIVVWDLRMTPLFVHDPLKMGPESFHSPHNHHAKQAVDRQHYRQTWPNKTMLPAQKLLHMMYRSI